MKRLMISVVLLAVLLASGVFSAVYVKDANERIQILCRHIREEAVSGENTADDIGQLCSFWDEHCRVLAFVENSSNVAAVSAEISRLPALAQADPNELIEQIDSICEQCRLLAERQLPHIRSLL